MRRVTPLSRHFGYERGTPVDRHYIETFLARYAQAIAGRVLEVGDDAYTRRFGEGRVTVRDVLHIDADNPNATFVDDLASGERLPSNAFDCVILTQTLHLIFDVPAAVRTVHRILKPGGVALMTVPGISQIHGGRWRGTWYWTFTPAAVRRLLASVFPPAEIQVDAAGNVFAACAFLQGMAQEELTAAELDTDDPLYPVIVTARARKPPLAS
jgi:SAM-dependent methyltransferase